MKGIILAGGTGSRLYPLTSVVNKQLIPVYDKPMVYYPMSTLIQNGIKDICIITSREYVNFYEGMFGNGKQIGLNIIYMIQDKPKGIAEAFIIAKHFIEADDVCLILGDNIFHGDIPFPSKTHGAVIYAYKVKDPSAYGVVSMSGSTVISIEEKPKVPKSNYAIPGIYHFDSNVVKYAKELKPSARGELEITDIMKRYMETYELRVTKLQGVVWLDAGTPETLFQASAYVQTIQERAGIMVGCIEESAYRAKLIDKEKFDIAVANLPKSAYRTYLEEVK